MKNYEEEFPQVRGCVCNFDEECQDSPVFGVFFISMRTAKYISKHLRVDIFKKVQQ